MSLPANDTRFLADAEELAALIADGAFVAMPPDYSLVAMEAVRALVRRGARNLRLLGVPQLGMCTGTLIGPSTVLTAKHCVLGAASLPDVEFVFAVGPDASTPQAVYPIVSWAWETSVAARTDLLSSIISDSTGAPRPC